MKALEKIRVRHNHRMQRRDDNYQYKRPGRQNLRHPSSIDDCSTLIGIIDRLIQEKR